MSDASRGHFVVVQPEGGASYWQPAPANGHADPKLWPAVTHYDGMAMGFQTIAVAGRIRKHSHSEQVELLVCFRGRGSLLVEGTSHELLPGTACFLGCEVKHEIVNHAEEELVILWVISPSGLEQFFATIGKPRRPGEVAPPPFERPHDVRAIEHRMGIDAT